YDLILMDVQMPVMDGYTASRTIRAMDDPDKAGIPIVAMTANAFEEDRQKAFDAGMNGHVPKPIDIPKLLETLETILAKER
ncbi:MAG: response regulator, partial [Lachnospiraceae bacterium]|nr:response regulator [Lachnospiraceae bacterium]